MIIELFKILEPILNLSKSVENIDEYCGLTDEYIFNTVDHRLEIYNELCKYDKKYEEYIKLLKVAKNIINRINNHDIYKFIGYIVSDKILNFNINNYEEYEEYKNILKNEIIIFETKIGFVSGNKNNPLKNINTHSSKLFSNKSENKLEISVNDMTLITPDIYQEYITMIFYDGKNENDIATVKNITKKILEKKNLNLNVKLN